MIVCCSIRDLRLSISISGDQELQIASNDHGTYELLVDADWRTV